MYSDSKNLWSKSGHHWRVQPLAIASICAVCVISSSPSLASEHNAAGDFSATDNPNGVWSFGHSKSAGGEITLNTAGSSNNLPAWTFNDAGWPQAIYNNTEASVNLSGGLDIPAGALFLHPPSGTGGWTHSVLRFTAPSAGCYQANTNLTLVDLQNGSVDASLYSNANSLATDHLAGVGDNRSNEANSEFLGQGDTISIYIGRGNNDNFADDSVNTRFTVTRVSDGVDNNNDGQMDACPADKDNDGVVDQKDKCPDQPGGPTDTDFDGCPGVTPVSAPCSQFAWSDPPTVNPTNPRQATGTINDIGYTYTSSQLVSTTPTLANHGSFPAAKGVPNGTSIKNTEITNNTIQFAKPMTNPVLVFASIGDRNKEVAITFDQPVQLDWESDVTISADRTTITGNEGNAIVQMSGQFDSITFQYGAKENYVNFVFGAALCVPRPTPSCPAPNLWGDVHVTTPDGLKYDFQDSGQFVVVASTTEGVGVEIQTRLEPWANNPLVTVNTAMATNVNGDRVGVYLKPSLGLWVNGTLTTISSSPYNLPNGGRVFRPSGSTYMVEWPNGFVACANAVGTSHLDIGVSRPSGLTNAGFGGLAGDLDGNANDDLRIRSGDTLQPPVGFNDLYCRFGNSWRVSQAASLFRDPQFNGTQLCTRNSTFSANDLSPAAYESAKSVCQSAGITGSTQADCILDVGVTGDSGFAASASAAGQNPAPIQQGAVATAGGNRFCNTYSIIAVAQNQANLANNCNLSGAAWNSDLGYHYRWCIRQDQARPAASQGERSSALASCH